MRVYALIFLISAHVLARHLVVEGGKDRLFHTPTPVQITNVAFGEEISDANSRTVVKLTFDSLTSGMDDEDDEDEDEEKESKSDDADEKLATTVLCSLTPGKVYSKNMFFPYPSELFVQIEQVSVNLVLDGDAGFKFQVTGKK